MGKKVPFAVIDKSSIAKPGLEVPAFVHLKSISVAVATVNVSVADFAVLKEVLLPSVAAPALVVNDAKLSAVKAVQVPAVKDVTVAPV